MRRRRPRPGVQPPVGELPRPRHGQEHIVLGVGHRNDGAAVTNAAGPAGNVFDVENRVAILQVDSVRRFDHAAIGTQDQIGHADIEAAMQLCLAGSHGGQPAEGNREAAQRFPLQVVVELAVIVAMQTGAIAVTGLARGSGDPRVTDACDGGDQRPRRRPAQRHRPGHVQEGTVEHQSGHPCAADRATLPHPVQPQRDNQSTRRMPVDQHPRGPGLLADDLERPIEFAVVVRQVGGEVWCQTTARRSAAFT
jgi:hypothetical protein